MATLAITNAPAFTLIGPDGARTRQEITDLPFRIGRHATNHLILRDARASRHHACVTVEGGEYIIEDLHSRHGVFVNGEPVSRKPLQDGDRVEFGFPEAFSLLYEGPGNPVTPSLFPNNLPQTGWLRAAGHTVPSPQGCGNFYDVVRFDESWGVIVADVTGEGINSQLLTALLQGAFIATADRPDSLPFALARLNTFFLERTQARNYANLFCGIIEADGLLRYINAGHSAPFLVPLNGALESLPAAAPPVGIHERATFQLEQRTLQPGDRLVIFTDGFIESRNTHAESFGNTRLRDLIHAHADRPCALLHRAILDGLEAFTEATEQDGGLTLVVLEYRPD